jgi:hypothetical protein
MSVRENRGVSSLREAEGDEAIQSKQLCPKGIHLISVKKSRIYSSGISPLHWIASELKLLAMTATFLLLRIKNNISKKGLTHVL